MHSRPIHYFRRILALGLLLALALAAGLPAARPAYAAVTIMVDPTANDVSDDNDGKCSLWEALQAISVGAQYHQCNGAGSAPYTIKFTSVGTLKVLNGNLPFVTKNISIVGPVIIEGNGNDNILVVQSSAILSLTNLTMTKGNPAILNLSSSAVVNIAGCSFVGNKNDGDGGAISSSGKLNIAGSAFSGNSSDGSDGGGAIWASGYDALAVAGTVFNGNIAKRSGGAIYATAPAVMTDVVFNGNIANGQDPNNNGTDGDPSDNYDTQGGGALFSRNDSTNGRKLTITRGVFNGNLTPQGHGGALYNNISSTAEIADSAFNGNLAGKPPSTDRHGGAIVNFGGQMSVTRTTFLSNAAQGDGGGVANDRNGELTLSNVSMTANAATGKGGGIFSLNTQQGSSNRPKTTALNVTLSLNVAADEGGGIYTQDPTIGEPDVVVLANTIIASSDGPGQGGNCGGGQVLSQGHNLDTGTSCGLDGPGDLSSANPQLNAPGFNGGPIPELLSQKLGAGSDAADAGDPTVCADDPVSNQDVRGESRPKGAVCDIGAFEAEPPVAGFGSSPVQPGPISFGNVTFGASQNAGISVFNTGDKTLQLSNPQISGSNAADFALLTSFPLSVNSPTAVTLRCQPTGSTPGLRAATFSFTTNDPNYTTVSYDLICNAVAQPVAGFSSTPIDPGPLDFGDVIVSKTKNGSISIAENGTAALHVNNAALGGANPGDFSIGAGINLTIADGAAPVAVAVSCTPTAPGIRSATLTVDTNDPTQPTVLFNLSCTGKAPPTPPLDLGSATSSGGGAPALDGPYGVAISPDGKHVYVVGLLSDTLHVFKRDLTTGHLGATPVQTFHDATNLNGAIRVFVSADGKNVYVTAQAASTVLAYSRDPDTGLLTAIDSVTNGDNYGCFPGPGCAGTIAGLGGAYGMAFSSDGQFVYVSGSSSTAGGGSSIVVLRRDSTDGGLTSLLGGPRFVQRVTHANLEGAYDLALSPDGVYLYAASYSNNPDTITVFKRNGIDGKLSYVSTVSASTVAGLAGVFRLAISPDGAQLYAVSYESSALMAFQRNPATGALTHIATYTDGGTDAIGQTIDGLNIGTSVALSPDGTLVYTTGFSDAAVAAFERDPLTGKLTFAQAIKRNGSGQPPLAGARDVVVSPDGHTVHASGFSDDRVVTLAQPNPKPSLESLAPASAEVTNGAITLIVNGSGFVPGAKVRWNNALDLATTFVNSSQLKASVGAGLLASAGTRPVMVINPGPGGGASNALNFTITQPNQNPVPSVDELNPAGAAAGDPGFTLTVKGANFTPESKVRWNGADRQTTYISPTTLQAEMPSSDLAQPGDAAVTVANPAPGGGTSNAAGFSVAAPGQNPAPAITSLSPAFVTAGANGALNLTILGSNFVPGAQAQWNGEDRPTTFIGDSQLRMALSGADLIAPGAASVQVINPAPGGGASNVVSFTIGAPGTNPVPALTKVTAITRNTNGTLTLTLAGSGFVAGAQARWSGATRTTNFVSAAQLKMTISANDFLGGTAVITVTNPAPGGGASNELLFVIRQIFLPMLRR